MRNLHSLLGAMFLAMFAAPGVIAAPPAGTSTSAATVDCAAAYGAGGSACQPVPCPAAYLEMLGTWSGQFQAYVRELSRPGSPVFRPYDDAVTYDAADCLRNSERAETLIIGHRRDQYPGFRDLPAKLHEGLMIMVTRADGTRLLRTVDHGQLTEFALSYSNPAAQMSVWTAHLAPDAGRPPMTVTTIDARDLDAVSAHTRRVVVTMTVGPDSEPLWSGVVAHGAHTRQ
jgi:hypothetical protein